MQVSRRDKSAAKQTRELVERGNRSTFVTAGGFLENEEWIVVSDKCSKKCDIGARERDKVAEEKNW